MNIKEYLIEARIAIMNSKTFLFPFLTSFVLILVENIHLLQGSIPPSHYPYYVIASMAIGRYMGLHKGIKNDSSDS